MTDHLGSILRHMDREAGMGEPVQVPPKLRKFLDGLDAAGLYGSPEEGVLPPGNAAELTRLRRVEAAARAVLRAQEAAGGAGGTGVAGALAKLREAVGGSERD